MSRKKRTIDELEVDFEWDSEEEKPGRNFRKRGKTRLCKACGKDAYPNYFYCPACHHKVSHSDMDEEYDERQLS